MTSKTPKANGKAETSKALKADLIELITADHGLNKKAASDAVEAVTSSLAKLLSSGRAITLSNLGTFKVVETAARTGVNPSSKEKISIPAGKKVSFKISAGLKSSL